MYNGCQLSTQGLVTIGKIFCNRAEDLMALFRWQIAAKAETRAGEFKLLETISNSVSDRWLPGASGTMEPKKMRGVSFSTLLIQPTISVSSSSRVPPKVSFAYRCCTLGIRSGHAIQVHCATCISDVM